ncbi:MAG: T9SS type A sorting domain-containing protein [Flavobacteriales bacterium]|nr:T9SS type A sorting domain-containing protein [Flavobacteriales bacterium]
MGCYKVEAFDAYGDGLTGNAQSYFRVRNSNNQVVIDVDFVCESSNTMVNDAVGVSEAANTVGVELYPNPTNGNVNLAFNTAESKVNVDVYNVLGERIMSRTMNSNGVQTIDMSGMNNGLYYFNITVGDNSTTRKVTLNR